MTLTPEREQEIRERAEQVFGVGVVEVRELLAEIDRLNANLRTVQNAAKTLAAAQGSELEHRRQNANYDHKLRSEHDSLIERDAIMTAENERLSAALTAAKAENERLRLLQEFAEDLAWRSYLGVAVLKTVLKKSKLETGADVSAKLLADIAIQYPHFPAKSALRTTARNALGGDNG